MNAPDRDDLPSGDAPELVERPGWLVDTPYWAISAILHLILFLIIMAVPFAQSVMKTEEEKAIVMRHNRRKPPPYDPIRDRDIVRRERIPHPKEIPQPVIPRKIDEVATEIPRGTDLEKQSNFNLDADSINAAIGMGGAAAGAYGRPRGSGSHIDIGATPQTEGAVRAALEWLRRHQNPDGSWSCRDFTRRCKRTCTNLDAARYGDGRGFPDHDVGVTALAMLAFTGFGQTHLDGDHDEYVECLRKAADFMKQVQVSSRDPQTDGRYGHPDVAGVENLPEQWIYDHAIATMAMAELLVMSGDVVGLKRSVRPAVQLCLRARNDGFGWRYGIKPAENDTSVTGWMVLALKAAKHARLGIPPEEFDKAFEGALNWFDRATAASGKTGYLVPGDEGSRLAKGHPDPYPYSKELSCMTAVGVLCRLFGG
ncbi:MAG: terpene cyclase/mutase family protein, partial [Planctomycetes bacterium]|nr:terpene cyclase/mutase family protein [Planctomycetota bacterium]